MYTGEVSDTISVRVTMLLFRGLLWVAEGFNDYENYLRSDEQGWQLPLKTTGSSRVCDFR